MRNLLVILMVALVLFGCTGPTQTSSGTTGTTGAGGTTPPAAAGGSGPTEVAKDLTGLGFSQLAALGIPVECSVKMRDNETGQTIMTRMYLKGKDVRMETATEEATCPMAVSVMQSKKNMIYIGCPGGEGITPQCQWIRAPINDTENAGTDSQSSTSELEALPAASFDCKVGAFGDEKFEVSGTSCSLEEIFGGLETG